MVEGDYFYGSGCVNAPRYDYKFLRLKGMFFCKDNWGLGGNLTEQLLAYLEVVAEKHEILRVNLEDCAGAVAHLVSHGEDVFLRVLNDYKVRFTNC